MKIIFTKHAKKKFKDLKALNVEVKLSLVKQAITNPLYLDGKSDYPKKIASIDLDQEHILRVVYRKENDTIIVITFYPTRKGRYFI